MTNLSDHEIETKRERAFRRGYLHGAEAIVQCIGERLLKSEREALSRWLAAELRPWATATHDADPAPPIAPRI